MSIVAPSPTPSGAVVSGRWNNLHAQLEKLRANCAREHAEAVARSVDDASDAVVLARRSALARTLEEIDAALMRLAHGTYGACTRCHAAIPVERLEFRPYAASCVACAGKA
jgi:RNA polymerase-binding transcription factor DksA